MSLCCFPLDRSIFSSVHLISIVKIVERERERGQKWVAVAVRV